MPRPTIRDLAEAAGLSIATVNRVLAGAANVRPPTRQRVQDAAERIGFYGLGTIQARVAASLPRFRLGFLLMQPHRPFYQNMAAAIRAAADAASGAAPGAEIEVRIEFLEDLSPQNTAARALALAEDCDAISVTTAVHPHVMQAIETIQAQGVPVFGLVTQLSATGQVPYIGLDNWKVGRTAAWAAEHICKAPGKLGILLGNHRYRNQEMNETGFRSYFREHAPAFTILEPISTFESSAVAQEMTERLLCDHPDLAGLYVAGGGISGTLAALQNSERAGKLVVIGYELMDVTRAGLLDGRLTLVISHPLRRLAEAAVEGMTRAAKGEAGNLTAIIPFDLWTRENL